MSKQVNKTMIGVFVVGAVALVVAGVLVFGSGKLFTKTNTYVLYFESSVKGLNEGSPVIFRGVRIGSVTKILLRSDPSDLTITIPVFAEVEPERFEIEEGRRRRPLKESVPLLIKAGLKAQLEMQSLVTGQLMVALDFYPDKPIRLVGDGTVMEIPTIPSTFEELIKKVEKLPIEEIFNKLSSAIEGVEKVVNSPEIMKTVKTLSKLAEDADKLVSDINREVEPLASNVNDTLNEYMKLARDLNVHVDPLLTSTEETVEDVRKMVQRIDGLATTIIEKTLEAIVQAKKTLVTVENVTSEDSVATQAVIKTLKELAAAARSLRILSDYLERHPEALLRGKPDSGGM